MSYSHKNSFSSVVRVPPMHKYEKIGSIFSRIFDIIFQTEQTDIIGDKKIHWDFSGCTFLHPIFAGAIAILKQQYKGFVELYGFSPDISQYLNAIYFNSPLVISPNDNDDKIWDNYKGKAYLPICVFNPSDASSVKAQVLIQNAIKLQLGLETSLKNIISLLLAELIDNITEHSKSEEGFIFCQNIPKEKILYVMICDTGRSIYSSYVSDNRYRNMLSDLESSGILLALSGKSTKDRPENENRGYGISKSRKLVVEGLGGEFFILSGSTFTRHDPSGEMVADLPGEIRWNGTAIILTIPTSVPHSFNIYNYIS